MILPSVRRLSFAALVTCSVVACGPAPGTPHAPSPAASGASDAGAATPAPSTETSDDAAIAKAAQEYLDLLVEIAPEEATGLGLHKRDAELDDRTIEGHDKAVERQDALLKQLEKRFEHPKASAGAKTDLAMLLGALRTEVRTKRLQRPLQRQPDYYATPLNAIFWMTAREYAPADERAKNVLARLEKIPKMLEAAKVNLLNPPRVWTEVGIDRAASAKTFLDAQRPFLEKSLPNDKARIDAALKGHIG